MHELCGISWVPRSDVNARDRQQRAPIYAISLNDQMMVEVLGDENV
jgi:hypothetical protein